MKTSAMATAMFARIRDPAKAGNQA